MNQIREMNIDGSNKVSLRDSKLRERRWNTSGNNKQMRVYNRSRAVNKDGRQYAAVLSRGAY
jgi:hypothetical protein